MSNNRQGFLFLATGMKLRDNDPRRRSRGTYVILTRGERRTAVSRLRIDLSRRDLRTGWSLAV